MFLGLVLIGFSGSIITIPILPEMLESIEEDEELSEKYDKLALENYISGMFIMA